MSTKLKPRVGKKPDPKATISTKEIRASKRLIRQIFGTATPRHKMSIILPGSDTTEVEVRVANAPRTISWLSPARSASPVVVISNEHHRSQPLYHRVEPHC